VTHTIACRFCAGTGHRALPRHLETTLNALGRSWRSTSEIHASLGMFTIGRPGLCNRLAKLSNMQLVEYRECPKDPRQREWRVVA
jgi:hypothetical protein